MSIPRSIGLLILASSLLAFPAWAKTPEGLHPSQQGALRAKLERIYYEQDLMIHNQKVDRSDLRHQQKEFEALKVFERIPFQDDIAGLKSGLEDSSRDKGVKLISFKLAPKPRDRSLPVPSSMYSDENPSFKLTDDQLTERIPFQVVVQGDQAAVRAWVKSWPEDQMRLTVLDDVVGARKPIRALLKDRWQIQAHAFRFREVKFPTLEPRDPLDLLPTWAQRDPDRFAAAEPLLWSYVLKTHAISPAARPLYRLREDILLNDARMSFFMARAAPRRE